MKNDAQKRNDIVESNLGLVHSCANKFRGRGVEYDDLFQAGCVGLIKAVDGFDESKGFSFSTYAVPAILGEIKRIFRDGGSVKVGRALKEKARLVMQEKERLTAELGEEPTVRELAEKLEMDISETAELLIAAMPTVSLTSGDESGNTQMDIPTPPPEDKISTEIALNEVVSALDERDRKIIEMRYYRGKTQTVVAQSLGMTQVQVSRREKVILTKLRTELLG
ncbi:MAG: sigma-70 family RNA polymerase sigma factor [Clostridiales bacterium]|nr:sigma-70 family RNA polymerase sigma factor [Clostridiales bacterium]